MLNFIIYNESCDSEISTASSNWRVNVREKPSMRKVRKNQEHLNDKAFTGLWELSLNWKIFVEGRSNKIKKKEETQNKIKPKNPNW